MENVMFAKITEEEAMQVNGGGWKRDLGEGLSEIGASVGLGGLAGWAFGPAGFFVGLIFNLAGLGIAMVGDALMKADE